MTSQYLIPWVQQTAAVWPLTWEISGGDAPADYSKTDGYKVTATQYFPTLPNVNTSMGGACVEYLNEYGTRMLSTDTAAGAPVICLFIKFGTAPATDATKA